MPIQPRLCRPILIEIVKNGHPSSSSEGCSSSLNSCYEVQKLLGIFFLHYCRPRVFFFFLHYCRPRVLLFFCNGHSVPCSSYKDIGVQIFIFIPDLTILRFIFLYSYSTAHHYFYSLLCLVNTSIYLTTFSTSVQYIFAAAKMLTFSQNQRCKQKLVGDSQRRVELLASCFFPQSVWC